MDITLESNNCLVELLESKTAVFLTEISKAKFQFYHNSQEYKPFFSVFYDDSLFFNQEKFEWLIEDFCRRYLLNEFIVDALQKQTINAVNPKRSKIAAGGYKLEVHERINPIEFIVYESKQCVGYKYSLSWDSDSFIEEIKENKLDKIIILSFQEKLTISNDFELITKRIPTLEYEIIPFKDYFDAHFPSFYDTYVNNVKSAIKKARDIAGFSSIPLLNKHFLPRFKTSSKKKIRNDLEAIAEYIVNDNRNSFVRIHEITPFAKKRFLDNHLYDALFGKADFSKSFITAEYLYSYFYGNNCVDFTSVISGYLKCLEQLLDKLVFINMNNPIYVMKILRINDREMKNMVREKFNGAIPQRLPLKDEYRSIFKTDLGSYIDFLDKNYTRLFINSYHDYQVDIIDILYNYNKECRNEHFHKDNINDWEEVRIIRNNTLFLIMIILGGYDFSDKVETVNSALEIYDDTAYGFLENLSEMVKHAKKYIVKFKGQPEKKAIIVNDDISIQYNSNGEMIDSSFIFEQVGELPSEWFAKPSGVLSKRFEIAPDKMPEEMWMIQYESNDKKKRIL